MHSQYISQALAYVLLSISSVGILRLWSCSNLKQTTISQVFTIHLIKCMEAQSQDCEGALQ